MTTLGGEKTVQFADGWVQQGFTQVPNSVLHDPRLTMQARLTYALLSSYAWKSDDCFPGQERLAEAVGVSDRALRTYINELKKVGLFEFGVLPANACDIPLSVESHW